jgi:hypothetical protein
MKKTIFLLPIIFLFSCEKENFINEETVYFVESNDSVNLSFNIKKRSSRTQLLMADKSDYSFGSVSYSGLGPEVEISNDSVYVIKNQDTPKNKYGEFETIHQKIFLARINESGILIDNDLKNNLGEAVGLDYRITKITIKQKS